MPTWGELLNEVNAGNWRTPEGGIDFDRMRHSALENLAAYTGRNVVVYEADFLNDDKAANPNVAIGLADMQGLMEVFKDLDATRGLDLILHSPGGDPTAAESLMRYTRDKFKHVRVFVPLAAMSAATMWALCADEIVMGRHSQLGPIDPQFVLGGRMVPADAIEGTFDRAQRECAANPERLSAWLPTLQQYFPGLLDICDHYQELGKQVVATYLEENMFKRRANRHELAESVAGYFADGANRLVHSRGLDRKTVRAQGLRVSALETDSKLQDLVLTVHHTYTHTFQNPVVIKIVENNLGRAWVRMAPPRAVQFAQSPAPPSTPTP